MMRWVIDTNVPVVANGRNKRHAPDCRAAAVRFLMNVRDKKDRVVLDAAGKVEEEYRRNLNPGGQPGVGDRFYRTIHEWARCERVHLPMRCDGEYEDLPQPVIDAGFDRSDRKFAALAKRERIPVVNAVDSDWLDARDVLAENGVRVKTRVRLRQGALVRGMSKASGRQPRAGHTRRAQAHRQKIALASSWEQACPRGCGGVSPARARSTRQRRGGARRRCRHRAFRRRRCELSAPDSAHPPDESERRPVAARNYANRTAAIDVAGRLTHHR